MKKTLLIISFFILNLAFSQNPITVSGSCYDPNSLGIYEYNGLINGKNSYLKGQEYQGCSQITDEINCSSYSSYFKIYWDGTNWIWKKYLYDCIWLIEECVPSADEQNLIVTLATNSEDTPLPPCTGWSGDCTPSFSECTTLSLNSNTLESFNSYPNPTKNIFNIEFKEMFTSLKLSLLNIYGQVLLNETYTNSQLIQLNITQPNGVYFIKLTSSNNEETYIKLIKE